MAKRSVLTVARLREVLHYEPETGKMAWIKPRPGVSFKKIGHRGKRRDGSIYVFVQIDNVKYSASRIAWMYMTGELPPKNVDHINGNSEDNSWKNLRLWEPEYANNELSYDRLLKTLHYNPDTGQFTRIATRRAKKKVGRIVDGYLSIGIDHRKYQAHRLAFLYMTGKWPVGDVDHANGDPSDNKWSNLRQATRSQNIINRRKLDNRNISGYTGVRWHKSMKKWQAIFSFTFKTKEEAIEARRLMMEVLAGEFSPLHRS
jgi:hypothetical protein